MPVIPHCWDILQRVPNVLREARMALVENYRLKENSYLTTQYVQDII